MEDNIISRPYQVKLEEIASGKNTIIHLPTGSGKTYIAVCLIRRFGADLLKPWGQGGKRTFFLVNTVPLVNQQKKYIEHLCPVSKVAGYSSEDGVDYWNKDKWDEELEKHQVFVMTSQILCDMLTHTYIKVENINLLIFDECHHAVDDHPMRLVMKHFELCPVNKHPRVVGLTATLLNANVTLGQVERSLKELEATFHATIATVNELGEVLTYSTNPYETIQLYKKPKPSTEALQAISVLDELKEIVVAFNLPKEKNITLKLKHGQHDITTDSKKIVKAVKNMIVSMEMFILEMGSYGGALGILAYIILLERLKRKASTKEEDALYKVAITFSVKARLILLRSMEKDNGFQKIVNHSSEKILQLLSILKEYNPTVFNRPGQLLKINRARKPLCAVIFTQQRFTSKILYSILKDVVNENPEEFGFLKHDFVVGFQVNPFKSTREQHYLKKMGQKTLLMFANNDLNCLISTSVIEEGIDIPNCLLVVRFDQPLEYRSYIQSKGRARSKDASYVLMIDVENEQKFMKNYITYQKIESFVQKILVGNTDEREAPTEFQVQKLLYEDEELPSYSTRHGACLPAASAISLLGRYVSMLPHDQFTVITPAWIEEKVFVNQEEKRLVSVILPLGCPIKDPIWGEPQNSLKAAKRSAALNACKKLHEIGELDDVTLLPKQYANVNYDDSDVKNCFPNWPANERTDENENAAKPGSKKNVRKHKIAFPKYLQAASSQTYYLHVIHMETQFPEPADSRLKALYKLLKEDAGYGFLTQHALPKLCAFPAFLTIGEVTIDIEMNNAVIKLNDDLFNLVKRFHFFIFDQVLKIAKKFLLFEGRVNCMYIVPLKKTGVHDVDIDWDVITTYETVKPIQVPSVKERRNLQVTKDNYLYKVVTPWYRGTILPDSYIVSNVLDMTPQSPFESDEFSTYADYYSCKYNLDLLGPQNQSLLEVRYITSRMNCLLPRAATINKFTDKQKKLVSASQGDEKLKKYDEVFIAEFCIKQDYPSHLWLKAMILPSIIHRVRMLLVSHELLTDISRDINYGTPVLSRDEKWLPVPIEMSNAIKALLSTIEEPKKRKIEDSTEMLEAESANENITSTYKSMKDSLYQLQKKRINKDYPWEEESEPIDIERNLSTVSLMDIECYDEFVSAQMFERESRPSLSPNAPDAAQPSRHAAIQPSKDKYPEKIEILQKTPTGRGPELRDILRALTTIKSQETFSLERAETLGDSFLKFAATLYLYHKFPQRNEGQLTNIKGRLISNRNLYYAGERFNLGGRMKVEQFSPSKDFMVPGFFAPKELETFIEKQKIRPTFLIGAAVSHEETLSGRLKHETYESIVKRFDDGDGIVEEEPSGQAQNSMQCYLHSQAVSDKSVADCVEALIGTYLTSGGILAAIKILEWMRILPAQDNFAKMLYKKVPTVISEGKATPEDIHFLLDGYQTSIESILNYKFKDPAYLLEAMSHSSYIRNRLTRSYERMEFLGDAILDFLITSHMYENCPNLEPGDITNLRSALVNNVTFASYVVKLSLHKFMCKEFNPTLDNAVMKFVEHQIERNHEIVEDVLYLLDEEDCHVAEYIEVPKMLSDIFEALAGAIFLDCGGDLQVVWSVIYPIMCNEIYAFSQRIPRQPVAVLHENIHASPTFGKSIVKGEVLTKVMVPVTFTKKGEKMRVYGVGQNKSQAKRAAAKLALKILDT